MIPGKKSDDPTVVRFFYAALHTQRFGALRRWGFSALIFIRCTKLEFSTSLGCNSNCRFLVLASGMNSKPTLTFTEEEYIALARQKYNELKALKDKPTFYDYEKSFEEIWLDLGRQVLEKSLSRVPTDRRKKKA